MDPISQLRENLIEQELNEPIKWSFVVQTWETRVLEAAFPDKERHETLRSVFKLIGWTAQGLNLIGLKLAI